MVRYNHSMTQQTSLISNKRGLTTAAYYASFVAMGISMASLGPTLPALAENTHAGLGAISFLFTARALGGLLGSVLGGQLYDRLRGHRLMALMILIMAIFTALTPIVPLLWLLVAVLFITGAVQGVLNIGGNALLVWVHGNKVGPFMNGLHFFFGVGTFITPIIVAQFIARQGGLVGTYLLLAVIILPTTVLAFLPSPASPKAAQSINGGKKRCVVDRADFTGVRLLQRGLDRLRRAGVYLRHQHQSGQRHQCRLSDLRFLGRPDHRAAGGHPVGHPL